MIELVDKERCTSCNICVAVCPMNVFEAVDGGVPVLARQADCQTCFMCELYCPDDALYVSPNADARVSVDAQTLRETAVLGSYRRQIGWSKETRDLRSQDQMFQLLGH